MVKMTNIGCLFLFPILFSYCVQSFQELAQDEVDGRISFSNFKHLQKVPFNEGTMIEIAFEPDSPTNKSAKPSAIGMQRSRKRHKINRTNNNYKRRQFDVANNQKITPLSMIGAAVNALNPVPYIRESFIGVRNVFVENMKPFRKLTMRPSSTSSSKLSPNNEDSVPAAASPTNQGLSLQIPPELINHSTLEVNVKPNGEIKIMPVNTSKTANSNLNHNNNFASHGDSSFEPSTSDSIAQLYENTNKIQLLSDKPMLVDSIQDIVSLQNLVGLERDNVKLSKFANLNHMDINSNYDSSILESHDSFRSHNSPSSPQHIYLLPFQVKNNGSLTRTRPQNSYYSNSRAASDRGVSEIYYIDITIPDNRRGKPVVTHQRLTRNYKTPFSQRRKKRSTLRDISSNNQDNRRNRYLNYDGWQPLDVVDPMSNEPTLVYKPPQLERVHFGGDSPKEKPLFPIVPENPTVYVVMADAPSKRIHSVYGTENVDYVHINSKSNSVKAYSSFPKSSDTPLSNLKRNINEKNSKKQPAKVKIKIKEISQKENQEENSSLKVSEPLELIYILNEKGLNRDKNNQKVEKNKINIETDNENEKEATTVRATLPFEHIPKTGVHKNENFEGNKYHNNKENRNIKIEKSDFSDKSYLLDDDYYYVYDDYQEREANSGKSRAYESEDLLSSASTDPFASIIPLVPKFQRQDKSGKKKEEVRRITLHELLRNFDGAQLDRYEFAASENNEKDFAKAFPPPEFSYRKPFSRNFDAGSISKNGESSPKDKDRIPWYLIDTRSPRNKKNYEYYTLANVTNRNSHKEVGDWNANSFKTTKSATANSLSELLQIFKYVTTPSPFSDTLENKHKTFRYTTPTDAPEFTTERPVFRYQVPPFQYDRNRISNSIGGDVKAKDLPILNDSIIETNSLDGYLFSDSEHKLEFANPDNQNNIIQPKEISIAGFRRADSQKFKFNENAVKRVEFSRKYEVQAIKEKVNDTESTARVAEVSPFQIYQGHSKVKIFGTNMNDNKKSIPKSRPDNVYISRSRHSTPAASQPFGVRVNPIRLSLHDKNDLSATPSTTTISRMETKKSYSATIPDETIPKSPESITESILNSKPGSKNKVAGKPDLTARISEDFQDDYYDFYNFHGSDPRNEPIKNDEKNGFSRLDSKNVNEKQLPPSNLRDLRLPSNSVTKSLLSSTLGEQSSGGLKNTRPFDLSSIASPLEAFSKLFFSYFSPSKEEVKSPQSRSSQQDLRPSQLPNFPRTTQPRPGIFTRRIGPYEEFRRYDVVREAPSHPLPYRNHMT